MIHRNSGFLAILELFLFLNKETKLPFNKYLPIYYPIVCINPDICDLSTRMSPVGKETNSALIHEAPISTNEFAALIKNLLARDESEH